MNFGALPEGKVGLGIPHGAPPPLVWGTQIIQEFNEGLVLKNLRVESTTPADFVATDEKSSRHRAAGLSPYAEYVEIP